MRKRIRQLGALTAVALLIAACALLLPHDPQLLQEAHVAQESIGGAQTIATVHWHSPSRFLVFGWSMNLPRSCTDITAYDLTTRQTTPMPALLKALQQVRVGAGNRLYLLPVR